MKDPILEEIRRTRERVAAAFNYDIRRIIEDSRRMQLAYGHSVVSLESGRWREVFRAPSQPIDEGEAKGLKEE